MAPAPLTYRVGRHYDVSRQVFGRAAAIVKEDDLQHIVDSALVVVHIAVGHNAIFLEPNAWGVKRMMQQVHQTIVVNQHSGVVV